MVKAADATHVDFHLLVETIVHDQGVSHPYARRLHPVGTTHVRSQLRWNRVGEGRTGVPARNESHRYQSQRSSTRWVAPISQILPARTHTCGKRGWAHDAFLRLTSNGFHGRHADPSDAIIGEGEERWGRRKYSNKYLYHACVAPTARPPRTMKARLAKFLVSFVQRASPRRWHATAIPQDALMAPTPPAKVTLARKYWSKQEIKGVYDTPLLELVFRAAMVHRSHNNPNKIQLCTLMNIKSEPLRLPSFWTNQCIQLGAARKIVRLTNSVHCPWPPLISLPGSYCSQSSRYHTPTKASRLLSLEPVLEAARKAKEK